MAHRRSTPWLVLLGHSACAVFAALPAQAAEAPAGDAFYVPPSPLPAGDAGGVIWYRESTFTTDSVARVPAEDVLAFQILYVSTTALGERNAVSATLLVPRAPYPGGPRPIVGYGVGTQGMGDACAASKGFVSSGTYESGFARSALDRGWAVAVSDYEGLGTPGEHTYVVNLSLGHAVIDSVRAAKRIPEAGLGDDSPVVFWGYSEGGAAVAAAAELAPSYAPELDVVAVASGAAPADLPAVARYQDGQLGFGSVFIAGLGYQAAYPELHLTDNLNGLGKTKGVPASTVCPPARADGGAAAPSNDSGDGGGCSASAGTATPRAPWFLMIAALATASWRRSRRRPYLPLSSSTPRVSSTLQTSP